MRLFRTSVILLFAATSTSLFATPATTAPGSLAEVRVDQHLGERLPLDTRFRDEHGNDVALRDCFHGRPVVLSLVYYGCPMLCTLTLNQLDRSLNAISESAGTDFDLLTISFDPRERPDLAASKKQSYLRSYRRPSADAGWHFLTGEASAIDRVTNAVGFRYRWEADQQLFVHPSALIVVTPDGRISRYFLGVEYPPTELAAAIHAARGGTIGNPVEAVYFYCMRYDANSGRYSFIINRVLQMLGAATVLSIGLLVMLLQRATARRERHASLTPA